MPNPALLARKLPRKTPPAQAAAGAAKSKGGRGSLSSLDVVDEERERGKESEWEHSGEYGRRNMQCGENIGRLLHFFGISSPLEVVWAHAVNSKAKLEAALAPGSKVMFLEADVLWGSCGGVRNLAVMAHPPRNSSDLTFLAFFSRVVEHNRKALHNRRVGVKLDFKDGRCLDSCLLLLRETAGSNESVGFPVWLNADVWSGPGGRRPGIAPADFFAACFDIYPAGTLSPGWTCWLKFEGPSDAASRLLDPVVLQGYEMQHIDDALRTLPRGVGHVTFPVHCTMARLGSDSIVKLLEADPRFTLTLWGEMMPQDEDWMLNMPELQGRVFRDCLKPGLISYGLTLAPLLFQRATRSLALTAFGGSAGFGGMKRKELEDKQREEEKAKEGASKPG
mmetsp:Transcript_35682/g.73339  ORF Transcript_35682/g.73339 Transcript_35682/m.73339 type:complete len:393 (-) Transcript_35682:332-1510(-)|eukprot:CAMPEP_0181319602 /NCGR_PEP_ID=MMETSP1101-20121128/17665_1 /TAXON_ID=46948 /ORGANISM="Rhodomonas abbreviata, Strain Caron Lab Isolate" /LENGTH=392 /DNA_ID=CAMNT_0023427225 /DNA_START=378 /DNA_END=1556 /DNA_ORIENTATION=-